MNIAIIGGGAGGLAAALACAPYAKVTIYERQSRLGRKLLATGNGRCNLTNRRSAVKHYYGLDPSFAAHALAAFPPARIEEIFARLGVATVEEDQGRIFPRAAQAQAVLDNLRLALQAQGVEEICDCEVQKITPTKKGFKLLCANRAPAFADKVIVCTGSAAAPQLGGSMNSYRLLEETGHRLAPVHEAIVQLKSSCGFIKALSGQKFNGTASLFINGRAVRRESGEILFTDYGLSGLPILQLSASAVQALAQKKAVNIDLDLAPEYSLAELQNYFAQRQALRREIPLEDFFTGFWPKRIGQQLLKSVLNTPLSRPSGSLSAQELALLAQTAKDWPFAVNGSMGLKNAQAASGGIAVGDFSPQTLESRLHPGLYACGEVLDITGDCGGFNLQWAWASGLLAGMSACGITE